MRHPRSPGRALAGILLMLAAEPALAQRVGIAAAVNPASTGTPPGRGARTLTIGEGVLFRERITTSSAGSMQVLFIDKSTLNIGPGATVVVDEFVYDPNAGIGRTTLSVGRGILRYVGGEVSHAGGTSIRTPEAVLGVRGGTVTVERRGNQTRVVGGYGAITVQPTAGGEPVLLRPGYAVTVGPAGIVEGFGRVRPGEVSRQIASTTSRAGQRGGARRIPTDAMAAGYGVGDRAVPNPACLEGSPTFPGARSSRCYGQPLDLERGADEITRGGRSGVIGTPLRPVTAIPPVTAGPPLTTGPLVRP
ncbi:FecR domain-containing protein [uncultured Enterovirga sp.]|uniref:FecR family protein n=1 Tax=uncultured Enterovirga sp. TaxID=2026352 RepID=UPI0035CCA60F